MRIMKFTGDAYETAKEKRIRGVRAVLLLFLASARI